ncbi:MAG: GNAT family N-acetyltransferase [Actinobacteria bacterium]|nr:GNAT family N-acetyltransferase [Actinomycetota bacterium]
MKVEAVNNLQIQQARLSDAKAILEIQKEAYLSEAEIYNDYDFPPLNQTLLEMEDDIRDKIVLTVLVGKEIVGSVRAFKKGNTCYIGRLIVKSEYQNQGIGKRLMREIEEVFKKNISRYELFTGYRSNKNISLYEKLGYKVFKKEGLTDKTKLVYMEKWNEDALSFV